MEETINKRYLYFNLFFVLLGATNFGNITLLSKGYFTAQCLNHLVHFEYEKNRSDPNANESGILFIVLGYLGGMAGNIIAGLFVNFFTNLGQI